MRSGFLASPGGALLLAKPTGEADAYVRRLLLTVVIVLSCTLAGFPVGFTGTNTGAIVDGGTPTPTCGATRDVNFNVSGFTGQVGAVGVQFTMNPAHTWIGDLQISLIAPNATSHVIFSRVGANAAGDVGDNANLSGTYAFRDLTMQNIWTSAASSTDNNFIIPPGAYRTQGPGPHANDSPGPAFTSMNTVFATVPAANVNGTWTLRFLDCAAQDTGTVSAAQLNLLSPSASYSMLSGRVTTASGAGIRNTLVTVSGGNLSEPRIAATGSFGYYTFDGLEAAQSYIVTVSAKRFTFENPTVLVNLDQDLTDVDFTASELPLSN